MFFKCSFCSFAKYTYKGRSNARFHLLSPMSTFLSLFFLCILCCRRKRHVNVNCSWRAFACLSPLCTLYEFSHREKRQSVGTGKILALEKKRRTKLSPGQCTYLSVKLISSERTKASSN